MTPAEKVKAVTPSSKDATPSNPASTLMLKQKLLQRNEYRLPIAHSAGRAPAEQSLELRHGESSLLPSVLS